MEINKIIHYIESSMMLWHRLFVNCAVYYYRFDSCFSNEIDIVRCTSPSRLLWTKVPVIDITVDLISSSES